MPPYDMESSSGLIMSVIRILTDSKDDDERDVIKKKLEDCLAVSDQKLKKLISEHHKDLKTVILTFSLTSENLQAVLDKLKDAKKRLTESRESLNSKLDELRRLSEELEASERKVSEEASNASNLEKNQEQLPQYDTKENGDFESTLMENNVFNVRASETSAPSLFKFSRSSYAICFEDHNRELSI